MAKIYRQPYTSHKPLRSVWYTIPFNADEQDVEVVTVYTGKSVRTDSSFVRVANFTQGNQDVSYLN